MKTQVMNFSKSADKLKINDLCSIIIFESNRLFSTSKCLWTEKVNYRPSTQIRQLVRHKKNNINIHWQQWWGKDYSLTGKAQEVPTIGSICHDSTVKLHFQRYRDMISWSTIKWYKRPIDSSARQFPEVLEALRNSTSVYTT